MSTDTPNSATRGTISAQSLTSGEIQDLTVDTSGEGEDGLLLQNSTTMETSAEDDDDDDSDELVEEEVLDDTEYDEEEILEDDDLVEEVLLSDHDASDHDLVEEEVMDEAAAAPPLAQIQEEGDGTDHEHSEKQESMSHLQASKADLSVVEEVNESPVVEDSMAKEESDSASKMAPTPSEKQVEAMSAEPEPVASSVTPITDTLDTGGSTHSMPMEASVGDLSVGKPTSLEAELHESGAIPTGDSNQKDELIGEESTHSVEPPVIAAVPPSVIPSTEPEPFNVQANQPPPAPPIAPAPAPAAPEYFRPPPPVIMSASWDEEDPTDELGDRSHEIPTVATTAAVTATDAAAVETIPEEHEASSSHATEEEMPEVSESTPVSVEEDEEAAAAPGFVPGLGASGDEVWEEAEMDHPAGSSEHDEEDVALEKGTDAAYFVSPVEASETTQDYSEQGASSERFADEDVTESSLGKADAAPYIVVGAAAAAAAASVPPEMEPSERSAAEVKTGSAGEKQIEFFQNEFDSQPPSEMHKLGQDADAMDWTEGGLRRKPKMLDILLITLIVVVIIVLVTVIPIVLVNRNKSKDVPTSSPQASPSPTSAPSPDFILSGGPFTGPAGSNLGATVSIHGAVAVAGSPGTQPGSLQTYTLAPMSTNRHKLRRMQESLADSSSWIQTAQLLQGQEPNDLFGTSSSVYNGKMIVGAPGTFANGTSTATGAAYFYQFFNDSSSWTQLGSTMRGTENIYAVEEEFGASVSVSSLYRVVIGAPQRSQGDGAVYTFVLHENTLAWTMLPSTGLITNNGSKEELGSAVSISVTGDRMVVGAPGASGGSGRMFAFQWNEGNSDWIQVANSTGNPGDRFGSSVVCLSPSGDVLAAGAPGASAGSGVVRVFQKSDTSFQFQQLGPDILGESGDGLGEPGTISGSASGGRIVVLAGTKSGLVRTFEYDGSSWSQPIEPFDTSLSGPITSLSSDDSSGSVIVGSSPVNKAAVFKSTSKPTPPFAPTISPGSPPAATPSAQPAPTAAPVSMNVPTVQPVTTFVPSPVPQPITTTPSGVTTSSPSATVVTPTTSPSTSWTLLNTFLGDSGANLGVSVALVSLLMAAGATTGSGFVNTYQRTSTDWVFLSTISGNEQNSRFGEAVAFNPNDAGLLIGAPGTLAEGTSTAKGAAYYYRFGDATWSQVGPTVLGDADVYSANEDFGYSVAVSSNSVLAIGAPKSSYETVVQRGRVYSFVFDSSSSSWTPRSAVVSTVGEAESDLFGSAVDISSDGSTLVVGAPSQSSGAGAVYVYSWSGSEWAQVSRFTGDSSEFLGSSVAVLSNGDGSIVAAGGMGYNSGSGIIRVYQLQSGSYVPFGGEIIGDAGDALGAGNSLSGSDSTIIAGTSSGNVKTFAYNSSSDSWEQSRPVVSTGASSNPSLSGTPSLDSFVAGTGGDVQIYSG